MIDDMISIKKSMSELAKDLIIYPQVLKNIRVVDKSTVQNDPEVQAKVQEIADRLSDTGRILVRESGTEPLIRVMVEAESEKECHDYVDEVIDLIKAKGYEA